MLDTLRQSGRLMLSRWATQLCNTTYLMVRRMLVFSATLAYSGLHLSLWSGVFATAVGFTAGFGENRCSTVTSTVTTFTSELCCRKSFATLCCVLISIGEVRHCTVLLCSSSVQVSGGVMFGLLGHLTVRRGRHPVLLLGATVSLTAYRHLLPQNIDRQLLLVLGFKF